MSFPAVVPRNLEFGRDSIVSQQEGGSNKQAGDGNWRSDMRYWLFPFSASKVAEVLRNSFLGKRNGWYWY